MFNTQEFTKLSSDSTKKKLRDAGLSYKKLARTKAPMRGCAQVFGNEARANKWYWDRISQLSNFIKGLSDKEAAKSLLIFEMFQSEQKGPTGPIVETQFFSDVTEKFLNLPFPKISDQAMEMLKESMEQVVNYALKYVSFSAKDIRFDLIWDQLPNTTVRGFPFHDLGKNVDKEIKLEGGANLSKALEYFLRESQIVSFPGYRIQGKPFGSKPKIRLINIPNVSYQYINVGLYKTSMEQLKFAPPFSGWLDPNERIESIQKQLGKAESLDCSIIALDFSSFDTSIHPNLRKWANDFIVQADKSNSLAKYKIHYNNLMENQYLIVPAKNAYSIQSVPQLLLSGIINTQHDGSLINLAVQTYIAKRLGFDINLDLCLCLGDDVGFCVPNKYLKSLGYDGLLNKINEFANEIGFTIHTHKKYPEPHLVFLQKLYVPEQGIHAVGSWARALSSFLYKERFSNNIPGVVSLPALEIISQIAILNEAFGPKDSVNCNEFSNIIAKEWLNIDKLLVAVCQDLQKDNLLTSHELFRKLISLVNNDIDIVKKHLGILSYDHKGISTSIRENKNYGDVFPILNSIVVQFLNGSYPEYGINSYAFPNKSGEPLSTYEEAVEDELLETD